jgi:hypothetical protein
MQEDKKTCLEFQQQAAPGRAQDGSAQVVAVLFGEKMNFVILPFICGM